jgi:chemotaxis methyl-accepting protein methylase
MPEAQNGDFLALTHKIATERGFGCASYKEKCLRRRIAVRMRARGANTYADYARILDDDAAEYDRLIDALTINVTKLFRNWDVYAAVAANVVPALWHREMPQIHVWSAGCSSGDEPYSLAILFHRYAATNGMLSQIGRVDICGTDIDDRCLEAAHRGEFEEADFADTPDELRQHAAARR